MATIADVAHRASVTIGTVSNVLTGKRRVREETRVRVLAAIDDLGYRPNLIARGLAQRRTFTLGLIIPTLLNPIYTELADEIERLARENGYHILLACCPPGTSLEEERVRIESVVGRMVDGLLTAALHAENARWLRGVAPHLPIVTLLHESGEEIDPVSIAVSSVTLAFRQAGMLAARHLLGLGHRHLAIVTHPWAHYWREEGFCTELAAAGIALGPDLRCTGEGAFEDGYRAVQPLLTLPNRPTAVFATNDLMALGVIGATLDLGLRVPDDLSVVGMDDILQGHYVRPSLTTVAMPKRQIAQQAIDIVLRGIKNSQPEPSTSILPPHLVVRRSTTRRP